MPTRLATASLWMGFSWPCQRFSGCCQLPKMRSVCAAADIVSSMEIGDRIPNAPGAAATCRPTRAIGILSPTLLRVRGCAHHFDLALEAGETVGQTGHDRL